MGCDVLFGLRNVQATFIISIEVGSATDVLHLDGLFLNFIHLKLYLIAKR